LEILRVTGLKKSFGNLPVLRGIDLTVDRSEAIVLLGASGSGKSTLLRCLNFLEIPNEGSVVIDGKQIGRLRDGKTSYSSAELNSVRARVGMVFQQFNLFPHLTVLGNVLLGLTKVRKMPIAQAQEQARQSLARVGLAQKVDNYPHALSGGQQQRVAIARALAMEPALILFDEPTSALDPELVGEVLQTMRQLAGEGTTMLVVTHELGFAYNVADRVVFLHEGRILEQGPPREILVNPQSERMRDFLRSHSQFRIPEHKAGE
jgi:polar amino acid transport system ATP-binding protein